MTRAELIQSLGHLAKRSRAWMPYPEGRMFPTLEPLDPEQAHLQADELLLEYINDDEVSSAFQSVNKWYG